VTARPPCYTAADAQRVEAISATRGISAAVSAIVRLAQSPLNFGTWATIDPALAEIAAPRFSMLVSIVG
jgi:hypothetical protein